MKSEFGKLWLVGLAGLLAPSFINALGTNKATASPEASLSMMHSPASGIGHPSVVPAEVFQGRLQLGSSGNGVTSFSTNLARYGGDVVHVNGEDVSLGASGLSVSTSDHQITSSGEDRGIAMEANQVYLIYVSNSSANPFPSDLRASLQAPTLLNGIKYLGTSGNAANWRFVGWVRTIQVINSILFVTSETERYIINYYNRRPLPLRVVESTDSWTYNTETWRSWNNSTANRVGFISNGEDQVHLNFNCVAANSGGAGCFVSAGIGLDSTTTPAGSSTFAGSATWNWVHVGLKAAYDGVPSEGFHFLQLLEISQNVGTTYWKGDDGRTFIRPGAAGYVMG